MIRAVTIDDKGVPLLILGLSGENVTRLVADEPIYFRPDEMAEMAKVSGAQDGALGLAIMYGKTNDDIKAKINALMGPPTEVCRMGELAQDEEVQGG